MSAYATHGSLQARNCKALERLYTLSGELAASDEHIAIYKDLEERTKDCGLEGV